MKKTIKNNTSSNNNVVDQLAANANSVTTQERVEHINKLYEEHVGNAQIFIGKWVLDNVFNGDLEKALSRNPKKKTSFKHICEHADLRIAPPTLIGWVKAAAVHRELEEAGLNVALLSYSQLRELSKLPDSHTRITVANKAISDELTVEATHTLVQDEIAEQRNTNAGVEPRLGNIAKVLVGALGDPISLPNNPEVSSLLLDGEQLREELRVVEMATIIAQARDAKVMINEKKRELDQKLVRIDQSIEVLDQLLGIFDDSED